MTGNAKKGTYFRLYINNYKLVEAITCFSKEPFPSSNYIRLFGQHEQVLNNLCTRFDDKLIPDLYRYLGSRLWLWAQMIIYDVVCWSGMCVAMHQRETLESLREFGAALLQNNECQTTSTGWRAKVPTRKYTNLVVSMPGPGPGPQKQWYRMLMSQKCEMGWYSSPLPHLTGKISSLNLRERLEVGM